MKNQSLSNVTSKQAVAPHVEKESTTPEDLTGRDRLVSSVLSSWAAQSVLIVAGFIMPRMIDRRLGQELLGVWDFAWSLVGYFGLVQMGVVSAVNRYVAKYRAIGDATGVNRIASSGGCVLGCAGLVVFGLTVAVSLLLPRFFGVRLGENVGEAQWVVLFLGISLSIQVVFAVFNGVLTGCHQWGLHNINISGWYTVTVVAMIFALLLGGGLRVLAAIILARELLTDLTQFILAYRVCSGLRLQASLIQWPTIKELFWFGGKSVVPSVSNLLLNQTTSILIMAYLGPATLALYSRPRSIMNHVEVLVRKMAMTLTPTITSLESTGNLSEIRDLVIKATRYSFYLSMPIVLMLVIFGGPIMRLWMGSRYANGVIPAILAAGYLAVLVQVPAWNVLVGLNAHGRAGASRFIASLGSVALNVLVLGCFHWGLVGTAVAITLPLTILNIVDIPLLVCRRVHLSWGQYLWLIMVKPVLHVLPFALSLIACRLLFFTMPLVGLAVGAAVGGTVLGLQYWRFVLPERLKQPARGVFGMRHRLWGGKTPSSEGAFYDQGCHSRRNPFSQ
jgi:O-antigen/teichoic acid export membrane protein